VLHLVGATSEAWLRHCLDHLDEVLVDHAHCEHKAAVTALSFVSKYPDDPRLVTALGRLARDEAEHFARAAALCFSRGLELGHPQKDPYVDGLLAAVRKGNVLDGRVDRLLCCALIEGRSCERLKLLANALPASLGTDGSDELSRLYAELWREEATHHLLFIELAERTLARAGQPQARATVEQRLAELAAHEGRLVVTLPVRAAIH
jgi:tRNA-(ms[2]io[6]A)-hydroxylase